MQDGGKQYLIFLKYTREYLSRVTGYSKGTLSRIASGSRVPSDYFIGVCCNTLKQPQEYLFRLIEPDKTSGVPAPSQDLTQEVASRLTKAEAEIKALWNEINSTQRRE